MVAASPRLSVAVMMHCMILWQQATVCGSFALVANQDSATRQPTLLPSVGVTQLVEDSTELLEDIDITVDESEARSAFGTKEYWDDVYSGRGDFPADQYSWYYGWEVLGKVVRRYVPNKQSRFLVPGVGNDSTLVDLYLSGYHNWVGQDYSKHAVERQYDLLDYEGIDCRNTGSGDRCVMAGDVTNLRQTWTHRFDVILEKGLLDAVYLSGTPNVQRAAQEFSRVLRPGGCLLSVSGVVPHELRLQLFPANEWTWLHDGSQDLKAGCFVIQKKALQ